MAETWGYCYGMIITIQIVKPETHIKTRSNYPNNTCRYLILKCLLPMLVNKEVYTPRSKKKMS